MTTIAVLGSNGFVGTQVVGAVEVRHAAVLPIRAPRLGDEHTATARKALVRQLIGADAVVNCAGIPEATSSDDTHLHAANAELPGLLADVARELSIRFVHVSSAAVQGRIGTLSDAAATHPFSAYSRSKAEGERAALSSGGDIVMFRPPGVHHESRRVTQSLARLARSAASSVAGTGDQPSAQALLENVADAIAFLATCDESPPAIVHHPSEGVTARSILEDLGDHNPLHLPVPIAGALVRAAFVAGRLHPSLLGYARRAEMLWFGQAQAPSWLTSAGWTPVVDRQRWRQIGDSLRHQHSTDKEHIA